MEVGKLPLLDVMGKNWLTFSLKFKAHIANSSEEAYEEMERLEDPAELLAQMREGRFGEEQFSNSRICPTRQLSAQSNVHLPNMQLGERFVPSPSDTSLQATSQVDHSSWQPVKQFTAAS